MSAPKFHGAFGFWGGGGFCNVTDTQAFGTQSNQKATIAAV